ncbi:MAG TPA: glycoside hydrolase family 38 C-terminal domain-containing protein [Actinopolymorphaceae bacterium]|jgi:alpha-mannosidase
MPRPKAAPRRVIHMIGNAHIDPVWLWQWPEGMAEARATFASALARMEEYDDFVFTCDQVALLAWVEATDPGLFEQIRKRVAEGRWVNVGGWWVEPDCNIPTGESFVRQGLYGQRYLHEKFGAMATVGLNADPFGHHANLPQILRQQHLSAYCFLRPGPHEAELPGNPFWWEGPDGSRVLGYRIPHEYCSPRADIAYHTDKAVAQLPPGLPTAMVFYGVGNHGGGPTKANIASIRRLDELGAYGKLVLSSPPTYVEEVERAGVELPTWRGDLQHHAAGCYSAHSGIKAWMRRTEHALLTAEKWASIASRVAAAPDAHDELTHAWKLVLFNQFHDILPGTSIEPAYDDARDQLGEARSIAHRVLHRALHAIARDIDVPMREGTQPVVVFNPHPWPVKTYVECEFGLSGQWAAVEDSDGRPVPCQRTRPYATTSNPRRLVFGVDLPPLGYRLYRILASDSANPSGGNSLVAGSGAATTPPTAEQVAGRDAGWVQATEGPDVTTVENPHLRVEVDHRSGWLRSLVDKATGRDLAAGVERPHTVVSRDPTDTWGHRVVSYALPGEPFTCQSVRLIEHGPVRSVVRIASTYGRSTLVEELVLSADARHLEVRATLDWHEQLTLLKLRFPTALQDVTATYEIPYACLQRPADGAEEPGQSWVDVTGVLPDGAPAGLTIINDAKSAYDVSGGDIGITAARSPVYAWHEPRELDPDDLGPTSSYSFQDQGRQRFTYLLVPHAGDWRNAGGVGAVRMAAELVQRPIAMYESFHPGERPPIESYARISEGSVVATVLKRSEDGPDHLVVRAYESHGVEASLTMDLPLVDRKVQARFRPYEIKTFLVPVDGRDPVQEVDLLEFPVADPAKPLTAQTSDHGGGDA